MKKLIALGAMLITLGGCKPKLPFKIDFELAPGIVIGQENCSNDPSKNAWLIQLTKPSAGGRTFGNEITYNNIKYVNVVKTYNLADAYKNIGKTYSFHFYLDASPVKQQCEVQTPITFDILNIRIKEVGILVN